MQLQPGNRTQHTSPSVHNSNYDVPERCIMADVCAYRTPCHSSLGSSDDKDQLMVKLQWYHKPLYMCYSKVFDSIYHDKLWVTMMDIKYPLHLMDFLSKLSTENSSLRSKQREHYQNGFVLIKESDKAVGCVLSPYLFNIL